MRRKVQLRNNRQQTVATVLYFHENGLQRYVGIIILPDLTQHASWLYQDEIIDQVIADLAKRLNIQYYDYVEVNE
jgi:hypothetical protein